MPFYDAGIAAAVDRTARHPLQPGQLGTRVTSAGLLYAAAMQPVALVKLLLLLAVANGTPIVAKRLLRGKLAWPIDSGLRLRDGQPLFGGSKTWRGLLLALLTTGLAASLLGLSWQLGLLVAALAMAGDLLSSFVKRRLGRPPSSRAFGLDQIPESLLPLVAGCSFLGLGWADVALGTVLFLLGEVLLSRWLYRLRIRDQPY
jgi:CDP-diglyceride synthetase